MITMHCTYPDGTTSEARYGMLFAEAFEAYDRFTCDGWIDGCDGCNGCEVAREFDRALADILDEVA
jgi:hypothetical protein